MPQTRTRRSLRYPQPPLISGTQSRRAQKRVHFRPIPSETQYKSGDWRKSIELFVLGMEKVVCLSALMSPCAKLSLAPILPFIRYCEAGAFSADAYRGMLAKEPVELSLNLERFWFWNCLFEILSRDCPVKYPPGARSFVPVLTGHIFCWCAQTVNRLRA